MSAACLWEIAIKYGLRQPDFDTDPHVLRRGALDQGYEELVIRAEHAVAVLALPKLHRDPFDRLLIAQAVVEGITLLTSDAAVARYPGPIRKV
jgi:PIN domain nuclease of toxin-antitoxin system